jgi:hypothetical protein
VVLISTIVKIKQGDRNRDIQGEGNKFEVLNINAEVPQCSICEKT